MRQRCIDEHENVIRKRRRDSSPGPLSKCAMKEHEIVDELKQIHSGKQSYSDPQFRLRARMIVNGLHTSGANDYTSSANDYWSYSHKV